MSHWAELDKNNKVIRVTVGDNNDFNGDEGYQWLIDNLGGTWIKTSYNTQFGQNPNGNPIHKNYPGEGYNWDGIGFFPPQCHSEATLDPDTYSWNCANPEHPIKLFNPTHPNIGGGA